MSGEDGAHHQGVPHPGQPLGSVLQPVPRTHGDLHTGTANQLWRVKCQTIAMRVHQRLAGAEITVITTINSPEVYLKIKISLVNQVQQCNKHVLVI